MAGSRHGGIFGTPPEPMFNMEGHGMKAELLEEWLIVLAEQNTAAMNASMHKQGNFKGGPAAEFLFLTCNKLRLPPAAKYLALEMLDRFLESHVHELYAHVKTSKNHQKKKDWHAILDRVENQILLRIVSCCQLASKLTSHYKIVTPKKAQQTLREFGHKFSLDSILQSEMRVVKTLKYRVMLTSPLQYVETLLEILGHNDSGHEVKTYHRVCLKLLDHIYMNWKSIYQQVFQMASKPATPNPQQRMDFSAVERDYMLLGVAVIAASSYVLDQSKTDTVIEHLCQITRIPPDDVLDFATVLIQTILDDSSQ